MARAGEVDALEMFRSLFTSTNEVSFTYAERLADNLHIEIHLFMAAGSAQQYTTVGCFSLSQLIGSHELNNLLNLSRWLIPSPYNFASTV